MGGGSSKHKEPEPEAKIEHQNQLQSPTTNTVSSGFHLLELHGQTLNTVALALGFLALWAASTWKAGKWRQTKKQKKQEKIREEIIQMEEQPIRHNRHLITGDSHGANGARIVRSLGMGGPVNETAWQTWYAQKLMREGVPPHQMPLFTIPPPTTVSGAVTPGSPSPYTVEATKITTQDETMRAILPIMNALAEKSKTNEELRRARGRFTEVPAARRAGPRNGTGTKTGMKTSPETDQLISSEEEGILQAKTLERLQRR